MNKETVKELLQEVVEGRRSLNAAAEYLLQEMGRGGRILVVDENLLGLEAELADLNYTAYPIRRRQADDESIKHEIYGKVLVTRNGKDFADGVSSGYYGLVWVQSDADFAVLAKRIEAELMQRNFKRNLAQVIKV